MSFILALLSQKKNKIGLKRRGVLSFSQHLTRESQDFSDVYVTPASNVQVISWLVGHFAPLTPVPSGLSVLTTSKDE